MKTIVTTIAILMATLLQAQTNTAYTLVPNSDAILVEKFDTTNTKESRFTDNNKIYKAGKVFVYNYRHITAEGDSLYYESTKVDSLKNFKFTNTNTANSIAQVWLTVTNGLSPFNKMFPNYSQTVVQYDYPTVKGDKNYNGKTGVVENEANVWLHPPRNQYFEILELNPFPYIKAPYEVGTKWAWELAIGDNWGDARWKTWKGEIKNTCTYTITAKEKQETLMGKLKCYTIQATATSRIGATALTAYFNTKYGFVKLLYTNIDGSKTQLELVEVLSSAQAQ